MAGAAAAIDAGDGGRICDGGRAGGYTGIRAGLAGGEIGERRAKNCYHTKLAPFCDSTMHTPPLDHTKNGKYNGVILAEKHKHEADARGKKRARSE